MFDAMNANAQDWRKCKASGCKYVVWQMKGEADGCEPCGAKQL